MTAQDMLDALDTGLAHYGESITLQRLSGPPANSVSAQVVCNAVLRGYAPADLVAGSGITQQDQKAILSPTALAAASWPGSGSLVPRRGDRIVSNRGALTIQAAAGIYVGDVLVRIEAQARGT